MKRLIIMAALTVAAFGFNEANAQKVIKDAVGNVYIDVQDMPAGTFSSSSLNVIQSRDHADNSVFKKLQIAKADLSPNMNWATAVGVRTSYNNATTIGQTQGSVNTGCKTYTETGATSGWRVPTLRELQLMWIMKDLLVQAGVSAFASAYYWSSTENFASSSWSINFSFGYMNTNNSKPATSNSTRCVREVTN